MSTRGLVARRIGDGFAGRYNHFDSYPTGLGKDLRYLFTRRFNGDAKAMMACLIDDHPAGWSSAGEQCYCHPEGWEPGREMEEGGDPITHEDYDYLFIEWAYVIDEDTATMTVLKSDYQNKRLLLAGQVDLRGSEPDWDAIEDRGYAAGEE